MTAPGPRTAALLERTRAMEAALEQGGSALPDDVVRTVRDTLATVRGRLALGVDHTVVALAGGTGSGKSSLFNALARLDFADVGVRRPTTAEVTACVWAHDASGLLDWLGVARERRIERESALDGETQADLRGLVLLDLPDHDSVEPEHRAVVDRVLPLADLIVWVVDPQKYADDALHTGYLRHLVGHEAAMLVVLNQIDTVPVDAQGALMADVDRLLREDGLDGVGVHAVSATTGAGVPVLRGALAATVRAHGLAEVRTAAELDDAALALSSCVAPAEVDDLPVRAAVDDLATATGLAGVERAVASTGAGGRRRPPAVGPVVGPVHRDRVADARLRWLDAVVRGLPAAWAARVEREVAGPDELVTGLDERLGSVAVPPVRPVARTVLRALAALVGVLTLVVAGICVGAVVGAGGWTDTATLVALLAGGGLVLGVLLLVLARSVARADGRRRGAAVAAQVRTVLTEVVESGLAGPTRTVLGAHRTVREAAVRGPAPAASGAGTDLLAAGASTAGADASSSTP